MTSRRLAALAPWVHVAVVERSTIFSDLPAAVAALGTDPNVIWCTGPSKTADVEGILIEGVHGPGAQIALVL
jgi:L-lactate dehydrogenase complex protein LldG